MPRKKKFERALQLERAMELFWRKGFADTSLVDIERALQVKAPSIYATFGNKRRLFDEAISHYIKVIVDSRIETYLTNASNPIEGIRSFLVSGLGANGEDPSLGCLLTNSAAEFGAADEAIATRITAGLKRTERAFKDAVVRSGIDDAASESIAANLLVEFQGLLLLSKLQYDKAVLLQAIDRLVAGIVT